jgi:hypothetical protein
MLTAEISVKNSIKWNLLMLTFFMVLTSAIEKNITETPQENKNFPHEGVYRK